MSRRYGRNQKRKARQEIARLSQYLANYEEAYHRDLSMLRQRCREATRQLDSVREALGQNFIGLDPETFVRRTMELDDPHGWNHPVPGGHVRMEGLSCRFFEDTHTPHHQLHFRVELAGKKVGYALSLQAIRHAPAEVVARKMAHELARMLVEDLRKAGGQG